MLLPTTNRDLVLSLQVEKYALHVVENGKSVNEEVEVDVEEQTEVIRVPKHNDVDALELMNDYNSVIRVNSLSIIRE